MNPPTTPPPSQGGGRVIVQQVGGGSGVSFHQHPASAINSGTLDNERLPERLQAIGPDIADADLQVEAGWSSAGALAANFPAASSWVLHTLRFTENALGAFGAQTAYEVVGDHRVYFRTLDIFWTDWVRIDAPEETTLTGSGAFAGTVTLRKIDGIVYAGGAISRAAGSSTTYTDCTGAIPADFRPAADTELAGGTVFNTAVTHQFQALAAGGFQVRMSGATANTMVVNGHWAA